MRLKGAGGAALLGQLELQMQLPIDLLNICYLSDFAFKLSVTVWEKLCQNAFQM